MRQSQFCDHCGGRFGLLTHRWLGAKFCKRTCKDEHLLELAVSRNKIQKMKGRERRHPNIAVVDSVGEGASMLRDPRAMFGLLVVCAAAAWTMVLLT
jgi:hypothetical protein